MRQKWTFYVRALLALSPMFFIHSCKDVMDSFPQTAHEVGICVGDPQTRTQMLHDGLSTVWEKSDVISVWARNTSGTYAFSNLHFKPYGTDLSSGFFTATLQSPMSDGEYTYYCCYPAPEAVDGNTLTFTLPALQDGKVSSGADIMISTPVVHGPLSALSQEEAYSGMSMQLNRMMHQFRFFVPETDMVLFGETIEKIVIDFPKNIAGRINLDLEDPTAPPVILEGTNRMTLKLAENLGVSSSESVNYACLSILPTEFTKGDAMSVRAYTASNILNLDPINLKSRTFEAGHSTPVALKFIGKNEYCRVRFTVTGNNLGEDADSITLTAPSGCVWGDTGSNTYTYAPGHKIATGETFEIVFENVDAYRALSGKDIKVIFDTEHVTATCALKLPDMSKGYMTEIGAVLPYLLYEDFADVPTFSSNDQYTSGLSTGSKSAKNFLNGWTAGRAGAQSGKCIRIAPRRETSARYHARVDSAPIIALKKSADLSVTFDYGADNEYTTIGIFGYDLATGDFGQTFRVGYVTSTEAYKSGDDDGTYESSNSWTFKEYSGSYDSVPNTETYVLHSVPAGLVRISWRSEVQHNSNGTYTTCWLYIDNVKVQIAK